jgi:hypothetical protein
LRIEAARTNQEDEVLAQLVGAGERLGESIAGAILRRGSAFVPALIGVLEDDELAREEARGGGYAPIHAAKLLQQLEATDAIAPMLRVLARCDPMDILYSALVNALESLGAPVLEPALAAHAAAESEDHRAALANVLSGLGVRDDRILPILLTALNDDVVLGAGLLAEYGDPAALAHLSAALDRCELDPRGGLLVNQEVVEIEAAIEELGGTLTEAQREMVLAVQTARDEARAPLLAIGASEDDDEDDESEILRARAEVIDRFSRSPHAASTPHLDWIDLSLTYAAEHEGVSFSAFDARLLRKVVFELFPRKVSCDASAAPDIVRSLRAFWTFARDVVAHEHAEACLRELGDDAIPRLARRLEDPSNFGMAKSFVMMGRSRGFPVDSEDGLREWSEIHNAERTGPALRALPMPGRGSREENKRKKKLRKMRRKSQRKNRR